MKAEFIAIITMVVVSLSSPSTAQIYKCIDEQGHTTFSAKPGPGCRLVPGSVQDGIICDQFDVLATLTNSKILFRLRTDLPDYTCIMMSISRTYWEENGIEYGQAYFSAKTTAGELSEWHHFRLSNEKWIADLNKHRKGLSRVNVAGDIKFISDDIVISMTVPINQPNPRFGKSNKNLSGNAVATNGLRVVRGEKKIYYPLASTAEAKKSFPSLDPMNLDIGQSYVLSKKTPLMPTHIPKDVFKALKHAKAIPQGGVIKILQVHEKEGRPWYQVLVINREKQFLATGWINSGALIGQQLKILE